MKPTNVAIAATSFALMASSSLTARETGDGVTTLPASDADVTGALKILEDGEAATIHYWNRMEDTITWKWTAPAAGNFRVSMNYSLAKELTGGKISVTAGDQRFVAPVVPTSGWTDYKDFDLGVIRVGKPGPTKLVLQGVELPAGNGAALPDVARLSLAPTKDPAASLPQETRAEFRGRPIFDGKTLAGWEGEREWFRVVDGAIVAGTFDKPIPRNEFLCTTREYGDFELRLKFRMSNPKDANGGVQFRSRRIPDDSEMIGYQADVLSWKWGGLYDESRRGKFLGTPLNEEALAKAVDADGWNDYAISCEGPRIRLWVNEVLALDYTEDDPTIPRKGKIGLQIHSGPPSEVHYKDIELQMLGPAGK